LRHWVQGSRADILHFVHITLQFGMLYELRSLTRVRLIWGLCDVCAKHQTACNQPLFNSQYSRTASVSWCQNAQPF